MHKELDECKAVLDSYHTSSAEVKEELEQICAELTESMAPLPSMVARGRDLVQTCELCESKLDSLGVLVYHLDICRQYWLWRARLCSSQSSNAGMRRILEG